LLPADTVTSARPNWRLASWRAVVARACRNVVLPPIPKGLLALSADEATLAAYVASEADICATRDADGQWHQAYPAIQDANREPAADAMARLVGVLGDESADASGYCARLMACARETPQHADLCAVALGELAHTQPPPQAAAQLEEMSVLVEPWPDVQRRVRLEQAALRYLGTNRVDGTQPWLFEDYLAYRSVELKAVAANLYLRSLWSEGRWWEAWAVGRLALDQLGTQLANTPTARANLVYTVAFSAKALGRITEAMEAFAAVHAAWSMRWGPESPLTAAVRGQLQV
jgi:hypothetical protein